MLRETSNTSQSPYIVRGRIRKLLKQVKMFAPSESAGPVWRYEISYAESDGTGQSLLEGVRRCGSGDACERWKIFAWESGGDPQYEVRDLDAATYDKHAFVADLNGDGRDELVYDLYAGTGLLEGLRVLTTKDTSAPLAEKVDLPWPNTLQPDFDSLNVNVADLDGDGRDDIVVPGVIVGASNNEYLAISPSGVFPSDPAGTYRSLTGVDVYSNTVGGANLFVGDIDGDGLPDLVNGGSCLAADDCSNWWYHLNQGNGTFGSSQDAPNGSGARLEIQDPSYQGGVRHTPLVVDQGWHRASVFPARDPSSSAALPWGFRLDPTLGPVVTEIGASAIGASAWGIADVNGDGAGEVVNIGEVDPSHPSYVDVCIRCRSHPDARLLGNPWRFRLLTGA